MAGDWIKMRCNLWTHPKVVTLSLRLSVTRAHVIGALHGAWSVADQHGSSVDMTPESLDALVETPGFTTQLVSVGWLSTDEGKLQFLKYEEHNGATAKARALNHKRVTASRQRNASVTQDRYKSVTREEKRRVEKNILSLEKKESKKAFAKPTVEEVRAYCTERKNQVDPERFIAYYDANGWRVGRNPMKDWRAAVRNWEKNSFGGFNGRQRQHNSGRPTSDSGRGSL